MKQWYNLSAEQALEELAANADTGLDEQAVKTRTQQHGPNEYSKPKPDSPILMALRQFKDFANIILLSAGFLSLALAIREGHGYIEPVVIFAIILMNIILAVTQERSAERALEALQNLNSPTCFVLRGGSKLEIDTAAVVPGDILLLKTGDLIPADARLLESTNLFADEASLTGESEPSEKEAAFIAEEDAPIGDMANMVFSGCLITAGNAAAIVTETGMHTQMGKIAGYLNDAQKTQTPLQKRLNKVSHLVSLIAIAAAVALMMIGLRQGEDFWTMMLAAVSLAVAAVPETLQLIVTLSLTHGVKKMVEKNALIRKLPAVETLGSTSVICSDKTGTLTQNRMTIQKLWVPGSRPVDAQEEFSDAQRTLLQHLALAGNASLEQTPEGETIIGDATESAILHLMIAKGENMQALSQALPRVGEVPFSSARKMMTTVHQHPDGGYLVLTKGAFDRLPYHKDDKEAHELRKATHDAFAHDALRMLALASRRVDALPEDLSELETGMEFEGIIGLIDPPRPEAARAIAQAKKAGVRTVMITGDHAATAGAIAKQLGLIGEKDPVITGKQLAKMSDTELIDNVMDYSVYARVSPEDKIRIVEAWQEHGEVVSMTGDGVNDAPALKAADVGVAMGQTGTEVSKSASDMVLTDDNFATIVSAISEGRNVFSNIRKTIYFLLVCNLSEIVIMVGAQLMGWGMPLTPVMLLLINVLGDGIPGLRLAQERSDPRIMKRHPIGRNESFFGGGLIKVILQQTAAFSVVGLIAFYLGKFVGFGGGVPSQAIGQTMAFLAVGFTSILHIFTVRSRKSILKRTIRDNWPLVFSALGMIALFTLLVLIPQAGRLFDLVPIGGAAWLTVLSLTAVPTIVAEIAKLWSHLQEKRQHRRRLIRHAEQEDYYGE